MGNRNRTAGNSYELEIVNSYKAIGFNKACSSRSESRSRDDAKVDICYTSPFNIQCKFTKTAPNMHELIKSMPNEDGRFNVVYHKRAHKGSTVTIMKDDFEELVKMLVDHDLINPNSMCI